jgi:predicted nucleic acid-binding protein
MKDGKAFLDTNIVTNIVLYAVDSKAPEKQAIARKLLRAGQSISTQVVNEVCHSCIRKNLIPKAYLRRILLLLYRGQNVVPLTQADFLKALELEEKHKFHYYDALIVASALQAKASVLYTEDLQHRQKIESLTILNPFI